MITEKYKIWDVVNNQWFKPVYPGFKMNKDNKNATTTATKEILFSMAGDMFLHTSNDGKEFKLALVDETQYKSCLFSGIKDLEEKKLYVGDVVSNDVAKWEIIFNKGCFCGKLIGDPDESQDMHIALRAIKGIKYIGNVLETPELAA